MFGKNHYTEKLNFILLALFLFAAGCSSRSAEGNEVERPNIIYILVDDMGYGDLGSYGQQILKTPNLDRMAAEGILFTDHYAGAPVCAPSRASLMTGRDTGHSRVRGNYETGKYGFGGELELRPENITIAEVLQQQADYTTAIIGKWGMGMNGSTGEPKKKGFDYSYGFLNQAHAHWHYPTYLYRNGVKEPVENNLENKRGYYSNDIFTDEALQFIGKERKAPFFLYLAYTIPHAELLVPDDSIFARYKGMFDEVPFVGRTQGSDGVDSLGYYHSQAYPKAAYASMITHIDNDVQKIIDQVKRLGIDENTVVMFSSDNGPHKEGGADPAHFNSNGPLKGAKRDVYEGGIRIPFIVRWPGSIKSGQTSDHVSAFWDMLPTMADLAGVDIKDVRTEGISIMPTLLGDTTAQEKHDYLYWEFHEKKYSDQAVRKGKWKAVRHDPNEPLELYDLDTDLAEEHNVAGENPDVVTQMKHIMETARTDNPYWKLKTSGIKKL